MGDAGQAAAQHLRACLAVGQRDHQPLLQPPPRRVVELLRPVGGPHDQEALVGIGGRGAVHLHDQHEGG